MIAIMVALLCACGIGGPTEGPYVPARRMNPPPIVQVDPCETSRGIVNSLPYEWGDLEPVRTAYNSIALNCLGWTPDQVRRWEAFIVDDVIKEESGGCWNVLRKGLWNGTGCNFRYPNGAGEDAGFFQLISIWYGPGRYLCTNFGTCGRDAVVASPFDSMISGLRAVMYDGSRPWCFDARARAFHQLCSTVPRNWG